MIEYLSTIDAVGWTAFIIGMIATILAVYTHETTYEEEVLDESDGHCKAHR